VDSRDEHVLIVRPVEDRDFAPPQRVRVDAPREVVCEFCRARLLEPDDIRALRIKGR
jgi:hypothetical protein